MVPKTLEKCPFAPGTFAKKRLLKIVFYSPFGQKGLKLAQILHENQTVNRPSYQMVNSSFGSSGMHRTQNFGKSFPALSTFTSRSFFSLSHPVFSWLCWVFSKLRLGGKHFHKIPEDREFFWTRFGSVVEQNLHWNFRVEVTCIFACFSGLLDWVTLIWVWFERSFPAGEVTCQSCPWSLKVMTSQAAQGSWFGKGRLRAVQRRMG